MDQEAPAPVGPSIKVAPKDLPMSSDEMAPSAVGATIAGCGGCGINLARPFLTAKRLKNVLYFDTSATNTRFGDSIYILAGGAGSGSNRSAHAREMESVISGLSAVEIGEADVAIVIFSLSGGSGSTSGPLMIREYARRGMRVIGVAVSDTSSTVSAKNTLGTLKTLASICRNNDIYLPMIMLSNDQSPSRNAVDAASTLMIANVIDLLTTEVFEVDQEDRRNWLNPGKVTTVSPGIKLMSFDVDDQTLDPKIVLGTDSKEMVDTLLILQSSTSEVAESKSPLPMARLKKTGFYHEKYRRIVGRVSSDIAPIEKIIDTVERMEQQEKSSKHQGVDRLNSSGSDDLIF